MLIPVFRSSIWSQLSSSNCDVRIKRCSPFPAPIRLLLHQWDHCKHVDAFILPRTNMLYFYPISRWQHEWNIFKQLVEGRETASVSVAAKQWIFEKQFFCCFFLACLWPTTGQQLCHLLAFSGTVSTHSPCSEWDGRDRLSLSVGTNQTLDEEIVTGGQKSRKET